MTDLIKTSAIVLHSIRWHETSKIVTLYTREQGLVKAIARGVYRKNNPLAGRLETLNLIQVVIAHKETRELQIITTADILDLFISIKNDLQRLPFALAMLEAIQKTLQPGHKDEIFFDFLVQMLRSLQQTRQPVTVFWYFLLKFCSYLGFKPDFKSCLWCGENNFSNGGFFILQKGGLTCTRCAPQASSSLKLTQNEIYFLQKLQNFPYKRIHEFTIDATFSTDLTTMLLHYLNIHLGHSLKLESLKMIL